MVLVFSTRPVVPGGAGGAMAPPDFGRSVNPITTSGGRLCPQNNTGTPGISDLPTALHIRNNVGNTIDEMLRCSHGVDFNIYYVPRYM